jgi:lipoprotein signal peptidase
VLTQRLQPSSSAKALSARGWWWAALLIIIVDQVSKLIVPLFGQFLIGNVSLQLTINPVGAFSLALPALLLNIRWVALRCYLAMYASSKRRTAALLIMLSGGMSNLIDRLWWGAVRDVISIGNSFFNLADVAIVGGAMIAVSSLLIEITKPGKSGATRPPIH